MAAIDPLLRALAGNQMDGLILEPGRLPRLRRGTTEHEVTQKVLDGRAIDALLAELLPGGRTPEPQSEPRLEFGYVFDGTPFHVTAFAGPSGWNVQATPLPAAARAGATAAPSPAATPAATSPPAPPAEAATTKGGTGALDAIGSLGSIGADTELRPLASVPTLLQAMVEMGASDLHLASHQHPRVRLDGELGLLPGYHPPSPEQLQALLDPLTPERHREEFERRNDADFAYEIPGVARFRVNLFRDRQGVGAVFRQIPHRIPTVDELGLPNSVRKLAYLSKGLVLVTGPTGSGKSTTLAALIDQINSSRRDHIVTIEDPIEFVHSSKRCLVNQREVGTHTASFKDALRAALREDPDIVLVGEMRDLETVSIAIETAETGHLVFGTLHTMTAPSTVERLVDQFPGDRQGQIRLMLADALRAVIAQTLLKRAGGGRVAAFEILMCTPAISNLIREGKTFQIASAMQIGKQQGMVLLNDALVDLVERGVIEPREAYIKAVDKEALATRLKTAGHSLDFLKELDTQP